MATKTKVPSNNRIADAIEAPATMQREIVIFELVGLSPLLQNNPASFIGTEGDSGLASKKKYVDAEEAELRVYRDSDGDVCFPAGAIVRSMVRAATGRKIGATAATTLFKGAVFIVEPFAKVLDAKGNPISGYEIDRRPVVVGKARIPRCRPMFPKWALRVPLDIDTAVVSKANVHEALSLAGRIVGIGDFRPEKSGGFGRFTVQPLK